MRAGNPPFNLGPYDVYDLVRKSDNVPMAQVDGYTGLLLREIAGDGEGVGDGSLVQVIARLFDGGFGERDHLVVGDGPRGVVTHGRRWIKG